MNKPISRTPPRGSQEAQQGGGDLTPVDPEPQNDPNEPVTPTPEPTPPPAEPAAHEYGHPLLRGRSPEEIESLFKMQENAMKEQGAQLTGLVSEVRDLKSTMTPPAPTPEADPSAQDYFADPVKTIRTELDRQIQPLREEIADARANLNAPVVRDKLAQEFPDWTAVEPYVDQLIARENFPDPNNEGLLRTMYFTAKGLMAHQGIDISQPQPVPAPAVPGQPQPAAPLMVPPQHRASSPPPPPPQTPQGPQIRELTENERRLAREYGMSAEDYIAWQETDMDEVADSEIGIPEAERNA